MTVSPENPRMSFWVVEADLQDRDNRYESVALVHAASQGGALTLLRDRLKQDGLHALSLPLQPVQAAPWDVVTRHRATLPPDRLLMTSRRFGDARAAAVQVATSGAFRARTLPRVTGWPSRRIEDGETAAPAALHDLLFTGESTYAVIDANRFFGLPERLESCGLRYRCLFKGDAARDYAGSAPYLVELLPDHPFTRLLFTQGTRRNSPNLWPEKAAIFLTGPLGLNALTAHLRHYTMLVDSAANKRLFFRFYAPEVLRSVVAAMPAEKLKEFGRGIRRLVCHDGETGAFILEDAALPGPTGQDSRALGTTAD